MTNQLLAIKRHRSVGRSSITACGTGMYGTCKVKMRDDRLSFPLEHLILSFVASRPNRGRVDEKWSELNKYSDILTVCTSVHAHFAPLNHPKMKHVFISGEESDERERRKCKKRKGTGHVF
jgi:hypothetical protein